jgi:putative peptidoglycan lipid II flippase
VQIPIGLVISSLAMPIYTRLSHHSSTKDMETFRDLSMQGFRLVLAVLVPITIWFITLRVPILRLLYQHGAFNARSTRLTSGTLLYFAVGLPGFGVSFYLQRLFFATQDTRSPARFSIITILVNIVGDIVLVHFMQADGLALATGGASWVNAALLSAKALKPRYNARLGMRRTLLTLLASGLAMLITTEVTYRLLHLATLHALIPLFFALILTAILTGGVFLLFLYWLRFPDLFQLIHRRTRRRA